MTECASKDDVELIAHDLNNQFHILCARIGKAMEGAYGNAELERDLDIVQRGILTALSLSRKLPGCTHAGIGEMSSAQVKAAVELGVSIVELCPGITCKAQVDNDVWPVQVDHIDISRVLQNLIMNSMQASDKRGTIWVGATNCMLEENGCRQRYVKIQVKDSGKGISSSFLPKVFRPGATTNGHGRGLGLATVKRIINECGGQIRVEANPEGGMIFEMYVPAGTAHELAET